ncbi:carboxymuconolactone decarboxylase family protein [Sandaracinus amylolyticus]|uniref:Carboxymuconolactone decarboxylase-like domain-containing protein n=1 Tax=Sandaracinus amylolyticus TaxID=927083 RepID=A0A0F6SGT7_9BACT|nr:carboxymuconolactone decarboxylase family protein [Sandaracinus amylolyticus]AKF09264.1 hypothetical protein DB32_006413 [Sandaracinus amylolyticus]
MSRFPDPLSPPYAPEVEAALTEMMPRGAPVPPLALFRFFAHHPALMEVMRPFARVLLGARGAALAPRDREIVILRATARARCEYEWGVHVAFFASRVGLDDATVRATVHGPIDGLGARDRLLVRAVDALHEDATLDDTLRAELATVLSPEQIVELLVLAGWYRTIACVANGAGLANEPWAPSFP